MRLAFYHQVDPVGARRREGGFNLASGLSARGHDIDLLVEEESGWLMEELRAEARGIRIVNLRHPLSLGYRSAFCKHARSPS